MALFHFTQEQIERRATEVARQHVAEQLERERAGTCQKAANAAAAPEPRPAKPITAAETRQLGIPQTDPWLADLERRERRAAGQCPQNGQIAAAGAPQGIEKNPDPPAAVVAEHSKKESVPSAQPSKEQVRRYEDKIVQVLSNLPAATRHDVRRAVHADRHPDAFKQAWKNLVRAGRILQTHPRGKRVMWVCPDR